VDINKIITRAKAMLLAPRTEWSLVAAEPNTIGGLLLRLHRGAGGDTGDRAFPVLDADRSISAVPGSFRVPIVVGVTTAVGPIAVLVWIYVVALIVDTLAPSFGGEKNASRHSRPWPILTAYWWHRYQHHSRLGCWQRWRGHLQHLSAEHGLPFTMKCRRRKPSATPRSRSSWRSSSAGCSHWSSARLAAWGWASDAAHRLLGSGVHAPRRRFRRRHHRRGAAGLEQEDAGREQAGRCGAEIGRSGAQANAVGQMIGAAVAAAARSSHWRPTSSSRLLPDELQGLKRTQMSVDRSGALVLQISKASATYSDDGQRRLNLQITIPIAQRAGGVRRRLGGGRAGQ